MALPSILGVLLRISVGRDKVENDCQSCTIQSLRRLMRKMQFDQKLTVHTQQLLKYVISFSVG